MLRHSSIRRRPHPQAHQNAWAISTPRQAHHRARRVTGLNAIGCPRPTGDGSARPQRPPGDGVDAGGASHSLHPVTRQEGNANSHGLLESEGAAQAAAARGADLKGARWAATRCWRRRPPASTPSISAGKSKCQGQQSSGATEKPPVLARAPDDDAAAPARRHRREGRSPTHLKRIVKRCRRCTGKCVSISRRDGETKPITRATSTTKSRSKRRRLTASIPHWGAA